jgi:hypothetical protein
MIALPKAKEIGELLQRLDELSARGPAPSSSSPADPATPAPARPRAPVPPSAPPGEAGPFSAGPPQSKPAAAPLPQAGMSQAELSSRWSEFLGEVRTRKISLWPALENAELLGVAQGIVRLGVTDEFQASLILKNKEVIGEMLYKLLNARLSVRPEISGEAPRPNAAKGGAPAGSADEHPVIAAMKRELGAEPL